MTFGMKTSQTCKVMQNDLVLPPKLLNIFFGSICSCLTSKRAKKTSVQNFMSLSSAETTKSDKVENQARRLGFAPKT